MTQGKALYAGVSSYSPGATRRAAELLKQAGIPLLIHQPSYSMLNRWIEPWLLNTLEELGTGCIAFAPLAMGLLTGRYLEGIPDDSRAHREPGLFQNILNDTNLARVRALNEIARSRDQSLAQLALTWTLRDPRVTSALIGASSTTQLESNLAALAAPPLTDAELAEIDRHAVDSGVDLWTTSSHAG